MNAATKLIGVCSLLLISSACVHQQVEARIHRDYRDCLAEARNAEVAEGWWCVSDGQIAGGAISGHVLYEGLDGTLQPVKDAELWRSLGDDTPDPNTLERVGVTFGEDGWFRLPEVVHYSSLLRKTDGHIVSNEAREKYVFVIRAPYCGDYILPFRTDDAPHVVVLRCTVGYR